MRKIIWRKVNGRTQFRMSIVVFDGVQLESPAPARLDHNQEIRAPGILGKNMRPYTFRHE